MKKDVRIFIAGSETLAGHAICNELKKQGYVNLLASGEIGLDLADLPALLKFCAVQKPEYVFMVAGKSGGIGLNRRKPADLMIDNFLATGNVLFSAWRSGVRKLVYLASSCVYPRDCPQPMQPSSLLSGPFEPTNVPYATAKLAGIVLCKAYRQQYESQFVVAIPATPFGPHGSKDPEDAHVVNSLMVRMMRAADEGSEQFVLWGTGSPKRDFIYEADLGRACIWIMENYDDDQPINVTGTPPISIAELAEKIRDIVGFKGRLVFDTSYPDGAPLKYLDGSELYALGWHPTWTFDDALLETFRALRRS